METTSNLVMNRLSASLEELGLDRRAYHILKRKGINRICDIIAHGESGILNIKGMGEITARHIFSVVARYLNIQQEELFSLEVPQNVKRLEEEEFDPLDASLSILNLPSSTLHHLNSFGLFLIRDLLGWRTKGTDGLHG